MKRGCQKQIIHIKDTGSAIFEEAYFVLRAGAGGRRAPCSDELLREADRLIGESMTFAYPSKNKRKRPAFLTPLAIGAVGAGAAMGAVALIGMLI